MDATQLNHIYKTIPEDKIPWVMDHLPNCLLEVLNKQDIKACKIADLGCGIGTYSLCLARLGFEIFGIDYSEVAIEKAKQIFKLNQMKGEFITLDLTQKTERILPVSDFAFDYEVLHHIFPKDRVQYFKNVFDLLSDNGMYLSVCFSEDDKCFGGEGKFRKTPLGTTLYFSNENEIRQLSSPLFEILELKTIDIAGKPDSHKAIYCLMQKKSTT